MNNKEKATISKNSRPFLLSVLSIVILTYSGVLELFTIALSIKYKWVTEVMNDYLPNESFSETKVLILSLTGVVVFSITFWSAVLIWKLKQSGFVIYISITIFTIFVLIFSGYGYIPEYITLIGIVFLIFFYSVKIKRKANLDNALQPKTENNN